MGARGFGFLVETPDCRVVLDPAVALGPRREFPVPHPREYRRVYALHARLVSACRRAEVVMISHFHQDHYKPVKTNFLYNVTTPAFARTLVAGKTVFHKDYTRAVNRSQARRGRRFLGHVRRVVASHEPVDGQTRRVGASGGTTLAFSPPVSHGPPGVPMGFVSCTAVEWDGTVVVFAPDVQGPSVPATTDWILARAPVAVFLGGPPLYLRGSKFLPRHERAATREVTRLARAVDDLVLDHHLLRSRAGLGWLARFDHAASVAKAFDLPDELLEADRAALYARDPPSPAFSHWATRARAHPGRGPPPGLPRDPPVLPGAGCRRDRG